MPVRIARGERVAFSRGQDVLTCAWPEHKAARKIGSGQDAAVAQAGHLVAFEEARSNADGERQFAIYDVAAQKVVARHPGTRPALSPTGMYVAFSRFDGKEWRAYVADAALKTKPVPLGRGLGANAPAMVNGWVGHGAVVAHSGTFGKGASVFALAPDGSVRRRVPYSELAGKHDLGIPFGVAWDEDLNRIVFEASTGETDANETTESVTRLFLYDPATKKRRQLTPRGLAAVAPQWYGDRMIVFTAWPNRRARRIEPAVYGMDVRTGETAVLIPNAERAAVAFRGE